MSECFCALTAAAWPASNSDPAMRLALSLTDRGGDLVRPRGRGEMWRKQDDREEVTPMEPGVYLSIPVGTHFQFRSLGYDALTAISVTTPQWPD